MGSVLYMYGTSQSLIINEDGRLEYSENIENYQYGSADFYMILSIPLSST